MKYCEEYAALLDLFADGELPPGEMERVQAHLETCPGCRAYVDDALTIRAGFPGVEDTAVPEGFAGGVMERVREDGRKDAKIVELRRRSVRRWAGSLAALAACCVLVIFLRTGGGYGGGAGESMVTGGAAAPAEAPESCDVAGGGENGISSRMKEAPGAEAAPEEAPGLNAAPAEPEEGEQKLTVGQAEGQMTAKPEEAVSNDLAMDRAATAGFEDAVPYISSAALPSAPIEPVEAAADTDRAEPALRLSVEEAGELLDDYEPIWRNAEERCYELSAEEYRALLEMLGRLDEAEGETFTVLVTRN